MFKKQRQQPPTQFFLFVNSRYDVNSDKKLDIDELKVMMEKLGVPQTHLGNE